MSSEVESVNLSELNKMSPEDLIVWAFQNYGDKAGIITSFQNTGCVMIDMASRLANGLRVLTVDTLRLHQQTYDFIKLVEHRYGIHVQRFYPDPDSLNKMVDRHGEFLFFDSKAKQEFCCHLRKVEPNEKALSTLDVWITGLRKDQSKGREAVPKAALVEKGGRKLIKLAPLVDWSLDEINQYIEEHNVPNNPLYDMGYTSLGCIICTTPTKPWEDQRAGRWRWFNALADKKECGIHVSGSGI